MSDLFDNIGGRIVPRDICERKHGGNPQSKQAFEKIKEHLSLNQAMIFRLIEKKNGLTTDEISVLFATTPNAISGRITELRMKGKIRKDGTRKTRSGCNAAVWKAVQ